MRPATTDPSLPDRSTEQDTMQHHEYPIFLQPGKPAEPDTTADLEADTRRHGPYDYSGLFSAPN
ncbi:hypothetical protein GCM10022140_42070 [Rhodococcus aetherivorans]